MNSAFSEFYTDRIDIAIHKDKFYAYILTNCDEFGWSRFMPLDEVQHSDGTIEHTLIHLFKIC